MNVTTAGRRRIPTPLSHEKRARICLKYENMRILSVTVGRAVVEPKGQRLAYLALSGGIPRVLLHCPECPFNGKPDVRPLAILWASSPWTVILFAEDMAASVFRKAGMFLMKQNSKSKALRAKCTHILTALE